MSVWLWIAASVFVVVLGVLFWLAVREYWHIAKVAKQLKMQDQQTEQRRRELAAMQTMLADRARRGYAQTSMIDRVAGYLPTDRCDQGQRKGRAMSKLRPEVRDNNGEFPVMSNGTAYFMIEQAVRAQQGLIAGRLHEGRAHCAIGSYWAVNPKTALPSTLIDEVAAVNDSMPFTTPRQRKIHVLRWLRWKLSTLGFPTAKRPSRKETK